MKNFFFSPPETITNGKRLAEIMGGKALRIRENVKRFFEQEKNDRNTELNKIFNIVKKLLIHDLSPDQFADMYAQTLVYGLFVARYNDTTPETFTRQEARDFIPPSNPFLQQFFDHIAGINFDKRLSYIVDELCEVFAAADIKFIIMKHFNLFGEDTTKDPIIHFYEDFLKEYDPIQRKKMGAYYTPIPVVHFIIRSVDEILKKEFGILKGLADEGVVTRNVTSAGLKGKETLHKVQVLDPAVGTATFLNETIKFIFENNFKGQEGRWPSYVKNDLLPRLYGFELMMVPYTIAHLKLSMTLKESGYTDFKERLGIYLTNTLDEGIKSQTDLFAGLGLEAAITQEAHYASEIKHNKPIMVVIGNPPYSVSSNNKSDFILNLIKDYKKDLHEKKINLDDDYIKFIRFAENLIEKNGEGIVAMITNNSFLDGITHRQMRKHLLETFDNIYILDLHGNSKKKETAPDGTKDENVFDIQQGVAISIFVKKSTKKKDLGKVYYDQIYGKREVKFKELNENNKQIIKWKEIGYSSPYYFFVPKDNQAESEYKSGFRIDELMPLYNSGIQSKRDKVCIAFNETELKQVVSDFLSLDINQIRNKYLLPVDGRDWKIEWAKKDLSEGYDVVNVLYRPFDIRKTIYTNRSKGFIAYPRQKTSSHFFNHKNLGLIFTRFDRQVSLGYFFITDSLLDLHALDSAGDSMMVAPLYLYIDNDSKVPNLQKEIVESIESIVGNATPEDVLEYIYAVFYSPNYREKYKEFLKIDFPRIPYPKDKETFWKLVEKGKELRELHLMESPILNNYITTYSVAGTDVVEQIKYEDGKVYINGKQYFGDVPEVAWNFYIGGYQPAQKWLKDRKGRKLESSDIGHYQKIIKILVETDRIMKEIDQAVQF